MKLLIITQTVDENDQLLGFFIEWIRRFAGQFERVTVLCLNRGKYNLPKNIQVISLGKDKKLSKIFWVWNFFRNVIGLHKQYDAVLVHMNPIWVVLGGIAWRVMRKKIFLWYTHKSVTLKLRLAEYGADKIFTASAESFRLPSKKVIVTGHGIDTELFRPEDRRQKTEDRELSILSVGRIAPVKNYKALIDTLKIIKDKGYDFHLTIVGEPPLDQDKDYANSLKTKIDNMGLSDKVNFAGKINHKNLPTYYQSHQIFVHLSLTGSLDKTLLEAMACGMHVLSSNDSAKTFLSAELIFDDNHPSQLAEKILSLRGKTPNLKLREYVVSQHNLERLILILSNHIRLS